MNTLSIPLSKRCLASENIPRDLADFAIPEGLKDATSRKTFFVFSLHPLSNPPITPAIP